MKSDTPWCIWAVTMVTMVLLGLGCAWIDLSYPFDLRSLDFQKAEARENARIGHLTMQNREACKKLEPGDIILSDKELWSVRHDNAHSTKGWYGISNLNSNGMVVIHTDDNWAMSPGRFKHIYKLGTKEWYQAAWMMALQGLPQPPKK